MNILPLAGTPFRNVSFTSKVVETKYGSVSPKIKQAVDTFEEKDSLNAEKIGEGLSSVAYKFNDLDCVIKVSKPCDAGSRNGDYSAEAKSLGLIPEKFQQAQKLIGSVRTERDNWYLLTTFVDGDVPDGKNRKWSEDSLKSALNAFAELDVAHVYHGDLAISNCLVTKDEDVRLLDFQYTKTFDFQNDEHHRENASMYKVPYFIAPSNAQMFEGANFATYLTFLPEREAKKTFATYVDAKADYHAKRAEGFQEQCARPEIVDYEKLAAKYLKNPSKDILDLCARKLEILLLHRYLNSSVEGYYNRLSAPTYYLMLIQKSGDMAAAAEKMQKKTDDEDLKRFLEYRKEDAVFWRDSMTNELDGRYDHSSVAKWMINEACWAAFKTRDDAKTDKFIPLPEIHRIVTGKKAEIGFKKQIQEDVVSSWMNVKISEMKKTQSFYCVKNSKEYKNISDYFEGKKAVIGNLSLAHDKYLESKNYEALFYSLEALHKTGELEQKVQDILHAPYLKKANREKMEIEAEFLRKYKENLSELNEWVYGGLFYKALGFDDNE